MDTPPLDDSNIPVDPAKVAALLKEEEVRDQVEKRLQEGDGVREVLHQGLAALGEQVVSSGELRIQIRECARFYSLKFRTSLGSW